MKATSKEPESEMEMHIFMNIFHTQNTLYIYSLTYECMCIVQCHVTKSEWNTI